MRLFDAAYAKLDSCWQLRLTKWLGLCEKKTKIVCYMSAVSSAGTDTKPFKFEDSHTRRRQHFPFGGINQSAIITLPLTRFPEKAADPSVNELRGGTLTGPLHCELSLVMRLSRTLLPFHFIADCVSFCNS